MRTNYLMITGSYPPNICGVGDYTQCFMSNTSNSWKLYYSNSWKLSEIFRKIKDISDYQCNNIIMQYPTQGYKWSILPQLLCIYYSLFTKKNFIVVLHEFSQRSRKAKLATCLFFIANRIIFTNEYERQYAIKKFRINPLKTDVIKIISNIENVSKIKSWDSRNIDIAYFGHLRPLKGLEDFLYTASHIYKLHKINITIIGQVLPEFKTYFENLIQQYDVPINLKLNLSSTEVSQELNNTKITFLPFPDGLSERRGSFLAAISNGSLVVSYKGIFTTPELFNIFIQTERNTAIKDIIKILEQTDAKSFEIFQHNCFQYLKYYIPQSWKEVVSLYEKSINKI